MKSCKEAGEGRSQDVGRDEIAGSWEAAAGTAADAPHLMASSVTLKMGGMGDIC